MASYLTAKAYTEFDPTLVSGYGTCGQDTAKKMSEALKAHSLNLSYDSASKTFTVLGSAKLNISAIQEIFDKYTLYDGWKPHVLDETDKFGNRTVKLTQCSGIQSQLGALVPFSDSLFSGPFFCPTMSSPFSCDVPEIRRLSEIEVLLSKSVIKALTSIMSNEKHEFTGIWYPTDLKEYFLSIDKVMPEDYWTGYANTDYFIKRSRFTFELKEGKAASEAIESMLKGPSVLDCGNATQLAFYKTLLDVLGKEKFDLIFSSKEFRLKITQNGITDKDSPISFFSEYTFASRQRQKGTFGHRPLKLGEECHFKGVKLYANKHPTGFGGGWNVIYIGDKENDEQLFIAHGFDKPMTEHEINQQLVELYNRERTIEDERFIEKENKPNLYGISINGYLRSQYTFPPLIADQIVDGFLVGSCRGLKSDVILRIKSCACNMPSIIENLFNVNFEFFKK